MKKLIKIISILLGSILGALAAVVIISAILFSPEYIYRILVNGESKVTDYTFFSARAIEKSTKPYEYFVEIDTSIDAMELQYETAGKIASAPLQSIINDNATSSLIVIHNDVVKYENYPNGFTADTINTSFSSVKSLDSLLIGMAIEDGFIKSVDQSIAEYILEFKGSAFESITIKNLLMMRSNIHYEEGLAWFTDDAKTYYMPDLRSLALKHLSIDEKYSGKFHYNNYHPLLLGIILERATGKNVADFFQEKVWNKIGAQHDASWSLDSENTGFEKMESGLNFLSIDYAKIGSMLLHKGKWNGQDIINEDWIAISTIAPIPLSNADSDSSYLNSRNVGYQYMWYSMENDKGGHDFFAAGKYGQYLYISPENNVVIVRTGKNEGKVSWWPGVFKQIAAIVAKD